jgi:hypothetical protein
MTTQRCWKNIPLLVIIFIMVGCSTSAPLPTPTPTSTPTPLPVPTPTPVLLSEINLEPIIILSGDLPIGYSGAQISDTPPEMYDGIEGCENYIRQQIGRNGKSAGNVSIFLCDLINQRDVIYSLIVDGFGESSDESGIKGTVAELPGIGEKAMYATIEGSVAGISVDVVDFVFVRCHSVVQILMTDTANVDYISAYAKRLDKRLTELICQ